MKKRLLFFLSLSIAGCTSGADRQQVHEYPPSVFSGEFLRIRETTRIAMRSARFPIEEATDKGFSGAVVEDRGFRWKLDVMLGRGREEVSVTARLEVVRDREFRPVRGALSNMGEMGLEEQRSVALRSNPEAYSRDREAMERHAPASDREGRIDALRERIARFLTDLEGRLRPSAPAPSTP